MRTLVEALSDTRHPTSPSLKSDGITCAGSGREMLVPDRDSASLVGRRIHAFGPFWLTSYRRNTSDGRADSAADQRVRTSLRENKIAHNDDESILFFVKTLAFCIVHSGRRCIAGSAQLSADLRAPRN
ncbi:uncharacterized protein BDV17DRAFT_159236 [Aspergillus undulatus]|uniref:uncharacterized protein n=1 Tax=Aspergillus undulatus TaxID=1810928 RepID=UPI003CCD86A3